jgi:acylglycerol lipase
MEARRGPTGKFLLPLCTVAGMALVTFLFAGCAGSSLQTRTLSSQPPRLASKQAVMDDGYRLPIRHWGDRRKARALVLALHGFNDYSNAFAALGPYLAAHGIATYAYDQCGFGATAQRGEWAGSQRMIEDLHAMFSLLRERHPRLPIYLLGESMGAAVVMATIEPRAAGIILVAPAVWSRDTMGPLQRFALWAASEGIPWLKVTGRGLNIWPSDNRKMLRAFSSDPLVIKKTRIDTLWGVTNLMDRAAAAASGLRPPALILYGVHDQIIPKRAFCSMLTSLPEDRPGLRVVLYRRGWHMLTRDLQGERVLADIAAWLKGPNSELPSGEEVQRAGERLSRFCRGQAASLVVGHAT